MTELQTLSRIVDDLASITIDARCEDDLARYASLVRALSRRSDALLLRIASRSEAMHAQGQSGNARDILGGDGHVTAKTARREAKRAETAEALPKLAEALESGSVSGEHLDIAASVTGGLTDEQRTHLDTERLSRQATELSPDDFARAARRLVDEAKNDWGLGRAIEEREKSELKMWRSGKTGMGHVHLILDPTRYSAFQTQLSAQVKALAAARSDEGGSVQKDEFLAAEAFVSLVEAGTGKLGRPTVYIHVDVETAVDGVHDDSLRETDCGHELPPETIQRFLCDSVVQPILIDSGTEASGGRRSTVLDVGHKYRTATERQWVALRAMYDSCAWSGCDSPLSWTQAHHVTFWESGGPTDLENLVPLCSHHHHQVHEGKWGLHLAADRTLTIQTPLGRHWKQTQPSRGTAPPETGKLLIPRS